MDTLTDDTNFSTLFYIYHIDKTSLYDDRFLYIRIFGIYAFEGTINLIFFIKCCHAPFGYGGGYYVNFRDCPANALYIFIF